MVSSSTDLFQQVFANISQTKVNKVWDIWGCMGWGRGGMMCVWGGGRGGDKVCDICGFMGWERGGGMGGGG